MSQAAIILDIPEQAAAISEVGPLLSIAEDAARQVRNQFPAEAPAAKTRNFTFSTTTTDSDPGAHVIRFNSAAPATGPVTRLYVDDVDSAGNDIVAELTRLDAVPQTVKGRITIQNAADPQNFARFDVTDVIDAAGYSKIVGTLKSFGQTSTQTNPNLIFANSVALLVTIEPAAVTRQSATLDSVVTADADLSALTNAEIAVLNAAAVDVVLATAETITVAGAAAGEVTGITGLLATDTLVKVISISSLFVATDLTSEFTVTGAGKINNTGGTSSATKGLVVVWVSE